MNKAKRSIQWHFYVYATIFAIFISFFLIHIFEIQNTYVAVSLGTLINLLFGLYFGKRKDKDEAEKRQAILNMMEIKNEIMYITHHAASKKDKQAVYTEVLDLMIRTIPAASKGSLINVSPEGGIRFEATVGFDKAALNSAEMRLQDSYLYIATKGQLDHPIIINDIEQFYYGLAQEQQIELTQQMLKSGLNSVISVPIHDDNIFIGMINLDSYQKYAFYEDSIELLQFIADEFIKLNAFYGLLEENILLSRFDVLTDCLSRRYFSELLRDMTHSDEIFSLLLLDLNNFKIINDTYGHDVGDKVLKFFAQGVRGLIPESSLFSRYGGDEFVIAFCGLEMEEAITLTDHIYDFFQENSFEFNGNKVVLSFSFGIVQYPDEVNNYKDLLVLCDERMYKQKEFMKQKYFKIDKCEL